MPDCFQAAPTFTVFVCYERLFIVVAVLTNARLGTQTTPATSIDPVISPASCPLHPMTQTMAGLPYLP